LLVLTTAFSLSKKRNTGEKEEEGGEENYCATGTLSSPVICREISPRRQLEGGVEKGEKNLHLALPTLLAQGENPGVDLGFGGGEMGSRKDRGARGRQTFSTADEREHA